ncbi:hypothetical protein A9Q81_08660 [Gammaproteobacteria bacterium 42_54_T18]|nr:hypothetical protein A9Q81_08660 [Gammaproteobacteria bacterium 42_54_T18]
MSPFLSKNKSTNKSREFNLEAMGFVIMIVIVTIVFLSLTNPVNSNLSLFFAFSLLSLSIVSLWFTHRNLYGLKFRGVGTLRGGADKKLRFSFVVENPTSLARSTLSIDLQGRSLSVFDLEPYSEKTITIDLDGLGRGSYFLQGLRLSSDYPIGFFNFNVLIDLGLEFLCLPIIDAVYVDSVNYSNCKGVLSDKFNLDGLREYQNGDAINRIYWPYFSKTDRLTIRSFEEELGNDSDNDLLLAWTQEEGDVEERIVSLTNKIVFAHKNNIEYGLDFPGHNVPLGRGSLHFDRCIALLANFRCPDEPVSFGLRRCSSLVADKVAV